MLLVLLGSILIATPPTSPRTRIVVTAVETQQGLERLARVTEEQILLEISRDGRYDAIGSSDVATMLGAERQKQLLGCSETSCLAEIAGAFGSSHLVASNVGLVGNKVRLDIKLVDTDRGRVAAREGLTIEESALEAGVKQVVTSLLARAFGLPALEPRPRWPAYALLGAGAGTGLIGGVLAAITRSAFGDLERRLPTLMSADAQRQSEGLQTQWVSGQALLIGGATLLVAGAIWWLISRPREPSPITLVAPVGAGTSR